MEGRGSDWGCWADLPTPRPEPTLRPALDFGHVPTPAPPALRVGTSSRWWQRWVGTAGLQAASPQTLPTAGPSPAALELGDVLVPPLDPAQRRERGGPGLTLRSPAVEARLQRLGCQVRTKCLLLRPGGQTAGEGGEDAQLPTMDGPSGRWSCTPQESPVQQRGAPGAPEEAPLSAQCLGAGWGNVQELGWGAVSGGRVGCCPGAEVRGHLWGAESGAVQELG